MASAEFLQNRITGKKKELEKLNKKLARILEAKEFDYKDHNPYYYHEDDLKYTARDIDRCEKAISDLEEKLAKEIEKDKSRDVAVILEFLEAWKKRVTEFYLDRFKGYAAARERYYNDLREVDYLDYWHLEKLRKEDRLAYKEYCSKVDELKKEYRNAYGFLEPYTDDVFNPEKGLCECVFKEEKLAKELDQEARRKYDFIIERTNAIVGQITDASNLCIGAKGDLNGYIIGTDGKAKVQTVGAGGYNIMCFHYRTLINPMK